MWDENLLLNADANGDAVAITSAAGKVNGAPPGGATDDWTDLWSENADLAPVLSEYEDSGGAGGMVRALVVEAVVTAGADAIDDDLSFGIEFGTDTDDDDVADQVDGEFIYAIVGEADVEAADSFVVRGTFQTKSRFVRAFLELPAAATGGDVTCLIGIVDGGSYTDF